MKIFIYIILLFIQSINETHTCKVVRVIDGDTIVVLFGKKQERIRLLDIDAPEKGQDFSEKSRLFLSEMISGKLVTVEFKERDIYGRILAFIYVNDINVNAEMVRSGLAWKYRFSKNKEFEKLQDEAKAKKLNIFSVKNPVEPYLYRKK